MGERRVNPVSRGLRTLWMTTVALAVLSAPARGQATSDSVKFKNDCQLATQVLTTGHPVPHRVWATAFIHYCGVDAIAAANVAALKRLRSTADSAEVEQVWNQLQYFRDARIYRAAIEVAQDRLAPATSRINALLWLQRMRAPDHEALRQDVTGGFDSAGRVNGGCGRYARVAGIQRFEEGEPLPTDFVDEITRVGRAVSWDASEPMDVRTAARCAQTLGWGRG
jgi:hypothetical protein